MCQFIHLNALCGHHRPIVLAGPFCQELKRQLLAIYGPVYDYYLPELAGPASIPFRMDPATCEPNATNTFVVWMWCGWECRNSYDATGAIEIQFGGGAWNAPVAAPVRDLGEPGAVFGVERVGVGWRDQQGPAWRNIEGNGW
ncbi:hypothetical protein TruAng_002480 [Truncatella angustata]|nr:hypothetical protein TruAng_002480 [Truncatella angustata]